MKIKKTKKRSIPDFGSTMTSSMFMLILTLPCWCSNSAICSRIVVNSLSVKLRGSLLRVIVTTSSSRGSDMYHAENKQ